MSRSAADAPQLSREELLQLQWLWGGILMLLAASTVLYLEIDAWSLLVALAVAVVVGVMRPQWLARIPPWVHRLAFPVIVTVFTLDLWLTGELLPATVRLDLLLLLYRALMYRQRRDDLQVIVLGLFLIVLAGVLTVALTFAVQILAFTAGALVLLLTITLADATDAGAAATPAGEVPAWARQVAWGRLLARVRIVARWRVLALGTALFVGLVAVSVVLFLVIPRFQLENGFFLERLVSKKARTGFSDTIRFGDVTEITQDNGVAVNVDVSDRSLIPAEPYWRMLVLDEYRDGTFRVSPGLRRAFDAERTGATLRGSSRQGGSGGNWTFYLESGVSRFLPLLGRFQALRFREAQHYQFGRPWGIVALRSDPVTMLAYRVEGMRPDANLPDEGFGRRLRYARANPRAAAGLMLATGVSPADEAELARLNAEIDGGAPRSTPEFARRAVDWLGRRHAYSLAPAIPAGAGDPLVRWLRSGAGGHCELFAGSLALLARQAGRPARLVTGFRGGTWNAYSNNFTLRNSDAHAWCEIYDEQSGAWVRVDPTPGATAAEGNVRGEAGLARRLDRSWTARLESMRVFWYRRIVNFDQRAQLDTLQAVKDLTTRAGRQIRATAERWAEGLKRWVGVPFRVGQVLGWMAALAIVGALGALAWRHRFRRWELRRSGRRGDRVRREAGKWLRRLHGARPTAIEVAPAGGETTLVADLQRLRFGPKPTWRDPAGVFQQARRAWRRARR